MDCEACLSSGLCICVTVTLYHDLPPGADDGLYKVIDFEACVLFTPISELLQRQKFCAYFCMPHIIKLLLLTSC